MAKGSNHQRDTNDEQDVEEPVSRQDTGESAPEELVTAEPVPVSHSGAPHHRLWHWFATHKVVGAILIVVVLLVVLASVPFTRFTLAGLVLKQNYTVVVKDQDNDKPVPSATVELAGVEATTDNKGRATIRAQVGPATLTVTKKYYKDASMHMVVPIAKQKDTPTVTLKATGRQVPISLVDVITHAPVVNATVRAAGVETKTNSKGAAIIVLPADKASVPATIAAKGYNDASVTIQVTTGVIAANGFLITPAGKVYFLSNQSGKLDVVSTNLDGSGRATVVAATGKESDETTRIVNAADGKYLALLSSRDGGKSKIFLVETATGKLSTIDEGDADFNITGWDGHRLIYVVTRNNVMNWQNGRQALKSFDADNRHITTLDQTVADGNENSYVNQYFNSVYILGGHQIFYLMCWTRDYNSYNAYLMYLAKSMAVRTVSSDGQNKKEHKTFSLTQYSGINTLLRNLGTVGLATYGSSTEYYEFRDDEVKPLQSNNDSFWANQQPYFASPSGGRSVWSEARDGKNVVFVGGIDGSNGKQVASLESMRVAGWLSDDYILASKDQSQELYILPATGLSAAAKPIKVTGYYQFAYGVL